MRGVGKAYRECGALATRGRCLTTRPLERGPGEGGRYGGKYRVGGYAREPGRKPSLHFRRMVLKPGQEGERERERTSERRREKDRVKGEKKQARPETKERSRWDPRGGGGYVRFTRGFRLLSPTARNKLASSRAVFACCPHHDAITSRCLCTKGTKSRNEIFLYARLPQIYLYHFK